MDYSLSETLKVEIIDLALQCKLDKVILFGSRARGDNRERSDIDLAIQGESLKYHLARFIHHGSDMVIFTNINANKKTYSHLRRRILDWETTQLIGATTLC